MAKIAFLSLVFPPDAVSTAQIMGDLAVDLSDSGHEVEVLTTTPHYNRDLEAEAKQPLRNHWGIALQHSSYHGIPTYHVLMPRKGSSIVARLLPWLNFHVLSTLAGAVVASRPDVIIVPSPPISIGVSAWLLRLLYESPFIYNVQEIYPDYAIALGAIKNPQLISVLYRLEKFVYDQAGAVTVISPHMREQLIGKGVPAKKIVVIPNFVDTTTMRPLPKDNDFSRRHGVHQKFLVSYAGNLGPAQDLDTFIDCAVSLRNNDAIHFMLMGDGMLRDKLTDRISMLSLPNVSVLPYQPYSLVPQIYAASDLCLVPQTPGVTATAVPSKVYRIMACARPVLAATTQDSDLSNLVERSGGGIVVPAGSPERLAEAIVDASANLEMLRRMGNAGREHVVQHYSRDAISLKYHELVNRLVNCKGEVR